MVPMAGDSLDLPRFALTQSESRQLIALAQAGDIAARDKMIEANLRLVASIANRYATSGQDTWDDLFQVGSIGLMKAIEKFDLSLNVRFSTYAVPLILGEIRQYLRTNSPIKVGRTLTELAHRALRMRDELSIRFDREPTLTEVAAALEVEPEQLVDALDAARPVASLFEPTGTAGESPYVLDTVVGTEAPDETGLLDELALNEALQTLTPRERTVLELRYRTGLTQNAIAPRLGVSQVHVFRIERTALAKVREKLGSP